jgi:hypothetical protein
VDGLHEARDLGVIAERDTEPADGSVQTVLEIDEGSMRPEPLTEFLPPDELARPLEQRQQNAQRLFLQRNAESALAELAAGDLQLERAESDYCLHSFVIEWIVY